MAVKTISIYVCDLCKNEFNDKLNTISMPVIFHTEQTEGRPCEPYLTTKKVELCQKCIDKTVILHGSGCMGNDEFYVKVK
jgi:hypothetical protein